MNKKILKRLTLAFNLIVIAVFIVFLSDFFGWTGSSKSVIIKIESGETVSGISHKLKKEGIVLSEYMFKTFFTLNADDSSVKPGSFEVSSDMPYKKIVKAIVKSSEASLTVTIPEGFTNNEIIARLKNNEIIDNESQFTNALKAFNFTVNQEEINGNNNELNGYLFPDTYNFYTESTPEEIIAVMTNNFKAHWLAEYDIRCRELNMPMEKIIILASIIQREALYEEDFYTVSSVFHNRLKIDMKLQSCATVQFLLNERKPVLSLEDIKIDSPYNTYAYKGLPPTAISSPGDLAIKAALYPDETDYLYFFTDKDGITHFSKTLEEHNSLMEQYPLQ